MLQYLADQMRASDPVTRKTVAGLLVQVAETPDDVGHITRLIETTIAGAMPPAEDMIERTKELMREKRGPGAPTNYKLGIAAAKKAAAAKKRYRGGG